MLSAGWTGLSVLYICPIKALLNNLDIRLQRYCALLGRRAALWHGDVKTHSRKQILRDPPDCLLTTPESLEVMLVSSHVDPSSLFRNLQVVIIDEIHAFAGDDRGWHLLAVLERLTRLAGREVQRLGLSATVGNPETLLDWLAGSCTRERQVCLPLENHSSAEVKLDYVGSLQNAAVVISRLHRATIVYSALWAPRAWICRRNDIPWDTGRSPRLVAWRHGVARQPHRLAASCSLRGSN
jgi:ATP-dependent Lhr-like helicase